MWRLAKLPPNDYINDIEYIRYDVDMGDSAEQADLELRAHPKRAALIAKLRSHAEEIREHGVTSLTIFGSRARGDDHSDSDLDVLIAYDRDRPFTLYDLVRVKHLLERLTGLDAHVSTRDGFPKRQLDRVLKDAVSVL